MYDSGYPGLFVCIYVVVSAILAICVNFVVAL